MAVIVYLDGVDPIQGSRMGLTFDVSQGGHIVKRKAIPINPQTDSRNEYRLLLRAANNFFWALNLGQRNLWTNFADLAGITGPHGMGGHQAGCAGFFSCAINAFMADGEFPPAPGPVPPVIGVTVNSLVRIDKDTVRATFFPSPAAAAHRLYIRQALPGPGYRRWGPADGYIAKYSDHAPNSPLDLDTKFQHLTGWHGRYWVGTQNHQGGRSVETLFEL